MRHINSFNERLGISKNLEYQVDKWYEEINSSDKEEFQFRLENEIPVKRNGTYCSHEFTLKTNTKLEKGHMGNFTISHIGPEGDKWPRYTINITNKKDKSTFLHEVKHFDSYIKNHGIKDEFKDIKNSHVGDKLFEQIFYSFNLDEFEAKYHGYYVDIDNYIRDNISKNPNKKEIRQLINKCLKEHEDLSYTWWTTPHEFKFDIYFNKGELYKNIFKLIYKFPWSDNIFKFYIDGFKDIFNNIKLKISSVFSINLFTKKEREKIDTLIKKLEKEINVRKQKYKRKFLRIFALMEEEYLTNDNQKKIYSDMKHIKTNEEFLGAIKDRFGIPPRTIDDFKRRFDGLSFDGTHFSGKCKKMQKNGR